MVYRHPSKKNNDKCIDLINETLCKIQRENKKVILTGDFNFDLLKHETNKDVENFLLMMLNNNYQPCITEPTRIISGDKPSLLDNLFSNSLDKCISGNILDKISDHLPSFVIFENIKSKPKPKQIKRRNMNYSNELNYQADLYLLLQSLGITAPTNAEVAYNYFHENHKAILNKHYPMETFTKKQQELELKPWITRGILTSIRIKSRLYKIFKKSQNKHDYAKFKFYRDTINSLLRKSKKQYHKQYFIKHANNFKKTWNGINNILHRQGNTKVSDIFLNIDGKLVTDQKTVVNAMNNYFINVADNLAKKNPQT